MRASWRNALIIIALADVVGTAFGSSFTLALDRPKPHGVPAGIVITGSTTQAAAGLQARTDGGFMFRPYPRQPPSSGPSDSSRSTSAWCQAGRVPGYWWPARREARSLTSSRRQPERRSP